MTTRKQKNILRDLKRLRERFAQELAKPDPESRPHQDLTDVAELSAPEKSTSSR